MLWIRENRHSREANRLQRMDKWRMMIFLLNEAFGLLA
jgi:hypothetical protein